MVSTKIILKSVFFHLKLGCWRPVCNLLDKALVYPQEAEFHKLLQISCSIDFFSQVFFLLYPKNGSKCGSFHEESKHGGKNSCVRLWQSFRAATLVCFRSDLSSHNWQVTWTASETVKTPFKRLHSCKTGGQLLFVQDLWEYEKVELCIWHSLAGSEGLCSGRVNCARLFPGEGRQTANMSVHLISQSSATAFIPRALAPLSVIRRKTASDKRQIFKNAKAFARSKRTIALFLSSFVAWLLRFENEVEAL